MNRQNLIDAWKREEQQPFAGWDFSHLDGRMLEDQPPWSYATRAAELMQQARSLLDMGTGGGERLLALREHWPGRVAVTEDYPPNVKLATERLAPLGVRVADVSLNDGEPLPFADGEFDLVLNRHSGLNAAELSRILAPGGTFLTQQIHGLWAQDLVAALGGEPPEPGESLEHTVSRLESASLTIVEAKDWAGTFSFSDVGAIVYYLKAIPWVVPGFGVETHLDHLFALQDRLERGDGLVFEAHKYLVEAQK